MVRPRTRANQNSQEPDLANVVTMLQRQLVEQQRETNRLREQIARFNQILQDNVVPPQENSVPPVVPQVPEVHQEVPRNAEVPLAPVGVQANPPLIREDLLYEHFRRMKAPEFEGPTDPVEVGNWLLDIQVILDFMGLTEEEKVLCASFALKKDARHWWMTVQMHRNVVTMSWQDFVTEFRTMYYNREILAAQQDEFNSLRQGSMTVLEAVKKFEQLARLCPELVPNETDKVRRMMKMFRTDIAKQVIAGRSPPTPIADCIGQAIRAEYWINQDKEAKIQILKAKKEDKDAAKQLQPRQNPKLYSKGQTSNSAQNFKQLGKKREKGMLQARANREITLKRRLGTNACYLYGKEGHYARNCTLNNQLLAVQAKIEGLSITQERVDALEPQARIYAYIKGDAEAGTSHVVTGQISVTTHNAIIWFWGYPLVCIDGFRPEIRKKS
ncbi:hypothetical protein TIFTF001_029072 [Ficus carica]|uniref:Retrotransposon gag domain-containing protein n=1 Tax=Ficus carica TaxID=3494 RepID=A0AA88DR61_FICCA|nr:hypothetical protein TIFTF001_029072 [Ficus carica]